MLGFNVDVDALAHITGDDRALIEAVTGGKIQLSKCLEDLKAGKDQSQAALQVILRRALTAADTDHADQIAKKRAQGLIQLQDWRDYYASRHPTEAAECDRLAEQHCHPEAWCPPWYDEELHEYYWTQPNLEDRHINDASLPDLTRKNSEILDGRRVVHFASSDPIAQRLAHLEAHRGTVRKAFDLARKDANHD